MEKEKRKAAKSAAVKVNFAEIFNHIQSIQPINAHRLAGIAAHLDTGKWPDELPGKPDDWDTISDEERSRCIKIICSFISDRIGEKTWMRFKYVNLMSFSNQEFEDFWDSTHEQKVEYVHVPDRTPISPIVLSGIALGVAIAALLFKTMTG